ncbi:MAG: nucleoside deaminase [Vampirovibrionia bacterium]
MSSEIETIDIERHKYYINMAIELAHNSGDDIPIAAITVKDDDIISQATNQKETSNDPTAHAEMLVLRETAQKLGRWRLNDITIYSTLEPCPMCGSAILLARIPIIIFSAYDSLYGAMGSVIDLSDSFPFYKPTIIGGIEEEKSKKLLKRFLKDL